jgi:hypothetical protein
LCKEEKSGTFLLNMSQCSLSMTLPETKKGLKQQQIKKVLRRE